MLRAVSHSRSKANVLQSSSEKKKIGSKCTTFSMKESASKRTSQIKKCIACPSYNSLKYQQKDDIVSYKEPYLDRHGCSLPRIATLGSSLGSILHITPTISSMLFQKQFNVHQQRLINSRSINQPNFIQIHTLQQQLERGLALSKIGNARNIISSCRTTSASIIRGGKKRKRRRRKPPIKKKDNIGIESDRIVATRKISASRSRKLLPKRSTEGSKLQVSILGLVHQIYQRVYKYQNLPRNTPNAQKSFSSCFKYENLKDNFWTCTFTCPITNQTIHAGPILDEKNPLVFRSKSHQSPEPAYIIENDIYYYHTQKVASNACAATIFDHIPSHIKELYTRISNVEVVNNKLCSNDLNKNFMDSLAAINIDDDYHDDTHACNSMIDRICDSNDGRNIDGSSDPNSYEILKNIPNDPKNRRESDEKTDSDNIFIRKRNENQNVHNILSKLQRQYDAEVKQEMISRNIKLISLQDDCKERNVDDDDGFHKLWRAEFTSPISKEIFDSGTFVLHEDDKSQMVQKFGKTYYNRKKLAKNAAVSRALDCFLHRGGWTNSGDDDYQFPKKDLMGIEKICIEEPYDSGSELVVRPTKDNDEDDDYHHDISETAERIHLDDIDVECDVDSQSELKSASLQYDVVPKATLFNRYSMLLKDTLPKDLLTTTSKEVVIGKKTLQYWTTSFECPVTGQLFKAGTLKEVAAQGKFTRSGDEKCPICCTIDGEVYYTTKKDSVHAATGRACDILSAFNFFSSFGVNDNVFMTQFCEEDPFEVDWTDNEVQSEHYSEYHREVDFDDDEDDGDENFIIKQIPQAGSSAMDGSNALQALLDAWADSFVPSQGERANDIAQVQEVISTAKAWCHHMETEYDHTVQKGVKKSSLEQVDIKTKVFGLLQTPVNTNSCNSILKALGNVNCIQRGFAVHFPSSSPAAHTYHLVSNVENQTSDVINITGASEFLRTLLQEEMVYLNEKDRVSGSKSVKSKIAGQNYHCNDIEKLANQIIKLMLKQMGSSKAFCDLNIETFNQYIRCIERESPYEVADVADNLLSEIKEKKPFHGYHLQPNTESFNAVMKYFLAENNHKKIINLLLDLVNDEISFARPNRETFMLALKSLANYNKYTYFDPIKARKWIECIEQYNQQFPQDNFHIDINMYNAVLPWSNNGSIYCNDRQRSVKTGPLNDSCAFLEGKQLNAANIEEWINHIEHLEHEQRCISPNIHTYEAAIQAWSEVGTPGLPKAEEWAKIVVEKAAMCKSIKPRLETFIPIIALWAQCGEKKGVDNVTKWIKKLDNLSETDASLQPNGFVRSYLIQAHRNYQKIELCINGSSSIDQHKKRLAVAEECYDDLLELIEVLQSSENRIAIDIMPFLACADIWNDVISSSMNTSEVQESIQKQLQINDTLNDFIEWWYRKCKSRNFQEVDKLDHRQSEDKKKQLLDSHLLSLHDKSAVLCKNIMFNLRQNKIKDSVELNFHHIESMLRRYEMHNQYLADDTVATPCLELYHEVLEWCQALNHPTQYGDAIRLAMYVLDMSRERYISNHIKPSEIEGISLKVIDVVCSVITRDKEKLFLLKKVLQDMENIDVCLDGEVIRSLVPQCLDMSDLLFSEKEERIGRSFHGRSKRSRQ